MSDRVLLDASYWIALRDPREPWHARARQGISKLLKGRVRLVFTSLILAEVYAYFCRSRALRTQVLEDAQHNPALQWEPVSTADETEAARLLRLHQDKTYSYCDAVSFVVMRRLRLQRAAAFDEHFAQFGEFELVS